MGSRWGQADVTELGRNVVCSTSSPRGADGAAFEPVIGEVPDMSHRPDSVTRDDRRVGAGLAASWPAVTSDRASVAENVVNQDGLL